MTSNVPPIATRSNDSIKKLCLKLDYSFSCRKQLEQILKLKDVDFVYLPDLLAVIAKKYTNPGANPAISGIYTGHMSATPIFTNALYFIFKLI